MKLPRFARYMLLAVGALFAYATVSIVFFPNEYTSPRINGRTLEAWQRLAEQGDAEAQYTLGSIYDEGTLVTQNVAEALKWYRLAAEQGDAEAQSQVGYIYVSGKGVLQDYAEAFKWISLAAKQGHPYAQQNLGLMFAKGNGVNQNAIYAHMWLNIAASNGADDAVKSRNSVELTMSSDALLDANNRARICIESVYLDCE